MAPPGRTRGMNQYDSRRMDRSGDKELVDRLMARDETALAEAIDAYGPAVLGVAQRVITERNFAEEVAQDTFLALWRRPGAFDPARGTLLRFLCGVVRNKSIDLIRKEESQRRTQDSLIAETHPGRAVTHMPAVEEHDVVLQALKELTESQREALVLAYFGGRTYREVAEELGIPEGTAKTRLRDGLIRLRTVLAGERA